MSDEQALLAAIWEHPHDDTPRLVYADWLDENGDEAQRARAEFIRLQCELAHLDEWDDERRPALKTREQAPWKKHAKGWKAGLPKVLQQAGFARGFPVPRLRKVRITQFLKLPPEAFAAAPLWAFHLPEAPASLDKLLACPHLLRVGTLHIGSWLGGEELVRRFPSLAGGPLPAARFAASPRVRNVANLNLSWSSDLRDDGLAALAAGGSGLPNLRHLDLTNCWVTDRGVAALAGSPLATTLVSLDLGGNSRARAAAVEEIFGSPKFGLLTALTLPATIGVAGLRAVCRSSPAFRLRRLGVYVEESADLGTFADWPGLESVRELDLINSLMRDRVGVLFRSSRLRDLRTLRLQLFGNKPSDVAAFEGLSDPAVLPGLRELHLVYSTLPGPTLDKLRGRFGDGLRVT